MTKNIRVSSVFHRWLFLLPFGCGQRPRWGIRVISGCFLLADFQFELRWESEWHYQLNA
jgi:hypothetical protein